MYCEGCLPTYTVHKMSTIVLLCKKQSHGNYKERCTKPLLPSRYYKNIKPTFNDALRGVCSVGWSTCELFLVWLLSCGNISLMNLPLVTNHPIMVRIAEGKKETINPPI